MKIDSPLSPQMPRSDKPSGRKAAGNPTKTAKSTQAGDSVQISDQAVALRSVAEANRVAAETRELIAKGNREAVLAQPVDVKRLQELLRDTGAVK